MHLSTLLPLLSFPLLPTAQNTTALPEPPAPPLTFLYTSYVHCRDALYRSPGPLGTRTAIPIIGGNFTGPRLSGNAHPHSINLRTPTLTLLTPRQEPSSPSAPTGASRTRARASSAPTRGII